MIYILLPILDYIGGQILAELPIFSLPSLVYYEYVVPSSGEMPIARMLVEHIYPILLGFPIVSPLYAKVIGK
ncbi:MAG: hypothetical protein ACLFUQ_04590 [Candidatus Izemoplasmataceae bacterium]